MDEEQRLAFGWASVWTEGDQAVEDSQGDVIDTDVAKAAVERAAYDFVLVSRMADEQHTKTEGIGRLVESVVVSKAKLAAMGLEYNGREGLWVGFRVDSEPTWNAIKSGKLKQFSIRGTGVRQPLAEVTT